MEVTMPKERFARISPPAFFISFVSRTGIGVRWTADA